MIIGVPKETFPGERRVALIPASVKQLKKLGLELLIECGSGESAGFPDSMYEEAGATVTSSREEVFNKSDILAMVRAATANPDAGQADIERFKEGQVVIAQCDPLWDPPATVALAGRKAIIFALELVPRITRAQSMDVLSSMATIAGYKAVLMAANLSPQMFPMSMTAAGTLTPARVFILGVGVAGLQAIATAKRLGAVVRAYDIRPEVKEQVESLGGKFVEMDLKQESGEGGYAKEMGEEKLKRQRELMLQVVAESDIVITTAAIPGRKSPILVTADMVEAMPPGSVLIDLGAERGGNCELTESGQTCVKHGVTIVGPCNVASDVPRHASQMYANNITTFLKSIVKDGHLSLDMTDEVIAGTLITYKGEVPHPKVRELAGLGSLTKEPEPPSPISNPDEEEDPDNPPPDTYKLQR
ncbi:MAG: Re/Si-specific NAD(P)(+) transhydrogenase subunit alpha [Planctomycetaceae bacterium]|nr:Re/Si-specific NAD(P)(+) transhydrogenase subunit alpha [Planctomycetaceae bacterium]